VPNDDFSTHTDPSESVRFELDTLLDALGGSDGRKPYKRLADELSKYAKKHPAWSRRYILSVHNGKLAPSKALRKAMSAMGAFYDGLELIAGAYDVMVRSHDESIAGAYVMGSVKVCRKCGVRFVPSIIWRKYCPHCRPPK